MKIWISFLLNEGSRSLMLGRCARTVTTFSAQLTTTRQTNKQTDNCLLTAIITCYHNKQIHPTFSLLCLRLISFPELSQQTVHLLRFPPQFRLCLPDVQFSHFPLSESSFLAEGRLECLNVSDTAALVCRRQCTFAV